MTRPTIHEIGSRAAFLTAQRGTCLRASVGAVIMLNGRIISQGYVGSPPGMPHCLDEGCELDADGRCIRTIHAEQNAISWAARTGTAIEGADLYCTHAPCINCAKAAAAAGIKNIYWTIPYNSDMIMGEREQFCARLGVPLTRIIGEIAEENKV